MKIRSVLVLVTMVSGGCLNSTAANSCPAIIIPAIVVEIKDAQTGIPIAQGAQGAVREGTYADSLRPYGGISPDPATLVSLQAALGRPGTYSIDVQRAGYLPWTASGVKVTSDECGVRTVILHADLIAVAP
jgi:hypothetical protein